MQVVPWSSERPSLLPQTVTLIALARRLGFAMLVAQVLVHLRAHGAFDHRLLQRTEDRFNSPCVIGPVISWSSNSLGIFGSTAGLGLGLCVRLLLSRHIDSCMSGYASNTKIQTTAYDDNLHRTPLGNRALHSE